jgi:hypothetical protein
MLPNDIQSSVLQEAMKHATDSYNHGHAEVLYNKLVSQIEIFQKDLDSEHEIGAYLAPFGKETLIKIEDISYHSPYFIIFYGRNTTNDSKVQLLQHVTQINILFVALKVKEERPPHRIGFVDKG